MFYTTLEIFNYFQNLFFRLFYTIFLYSIHFYFLIKDKIKTPKKDQYVYIATYHHLHNQITEYEIRVKDHVHKLKFLNNDFNKFLLENSIDHILEERNKILHCCLLDKQGDMVLDCTDEIRCFRYYFSNNHCSITWRMFLEHIMSLQTNSIELNNCNLLVCKNDDDLSEINFVLDNEILDNCIRF